MAVANAQPKSIPEFDSSPVRPSIVFLGPPGVGKGTYAKRLSGLIGVPHISAGELVRAEVARGTPLGRQVKDVMKSGNLIPDMLILEILSRRIQASERNGEHMFIFDGFPRTLGQAIVLSEIVDVQKVVNLILPDEILIAKCLGRRTCGSCNESFNLCDVRTEADGVWPAIHMPAILPPKGCSDKMVSRVDDTTEVIQRRLDVHAAESKPIEEYYRKMGLLVDFPVMGDIDATMGRVMDVISEGQSSQMVQAEERKVACA
eukprot:jgi/Mesvir1/16542/Mv10086-RA.1